MAARSLWYTVGTAMKMDTAPEESDVTILAASNLSQNTMRARDARPQ